jgi:hypothetical protein
MLRSWAADLRDNDERWQKLSQEGVQLFMGLIMEQRMPFAFETVFSYLQRRMRMEPPCKQPDMLSYCYLWDWQVQSYPSFAWLLDDCRAVTMYLKKSCASVSLARKRRFVWPRLSLTWFSCSITAGTLKKPLRSFGFRPRPR